MSELVNDNGVDREATPQEAVEIAAERARATKEMEEKQAAANEIKSAVLAKLGLTADEVAALLS
jgi:hypothetical protein